MQAVIAKCVTLLGTIPTDTSEKFREKMKEAAVLVAKIQIAMKKPREAVLKTSPQFATADILENAFFGVYKQAQVLENTCLQYTCLHVAFTMWTGPELDKGAKQQLESVPATSKSVGSGMDKPLFQAELDRMSLECMKRPRCPASGAEALPNKRARE